MLGFEDILSDIAAEFQHQALSSTVGSIILRVVRLMNYEKSIKGDLEDTKIIFDCCFI